MIDIFINNRRYACPDRWEQMEWRQLDAGLRCGERLPQASAAQADALTAGLLRAACRIRPALARRTDPADRTLFAARYAELARCELERLEAAPAPNPRPETEAASDAFPATESAGHAATGLPPFLPRSFFRNAFSPNAARILEPLSAQTDFDGDEIPAGGMAAGPWCEASDLFLLDRWRYAPLIASLLCAPAGKSPCERTVLRRADRLRRLSVPVFRELFRRIGRTHRMLRERYPLCYGEPSARAPYAPDTEPVTWSDLLMWTARHAPGETARLRNADRCEFLALAQSRIKMLQ